MTVAACASSTHSPEGFLPGAGGTQLYYQVVGQGPDTVVVVHGGPGAGMHTILPNLRPLAEEFTLVFYDQRGGGRSELPDDTTLLDMRYFAEDLEQVRAFFQIERLRLVAHSFGALVVASYLATYPEHVERAAFIGATGPRRAPAVRAAQAATLSSEATMQAARQAEVLGSLLRGVAEDPVAACREYEALSRALTPPRDPPSRWDGTSCDAPAEAVRYYYRYTAQLTPRSLGAWDFTTGLERVRAPLLVMHGDEDASLLVAQREWAAAVGEGRLLVVPGSGRAPIADRPDRAFPALASFLRGAWPEGAITVGDHGGLPR
ncbi:MAG: alpha/beta fold hydrolase [Gemmatimonadales bacterium]